MGTAVAVEHCISLAITLPGLHHGDLQAQPEGMHGAGDDDTSAVPASWLAGLGDGAAGGPGQHTWPHPNPSSIR